MPATRGKTIPPDALLQLRRRIDQLPPKSSERAGQVASFGDLYGVSPTTVYRRLKSLYKPHTARRRDYGNPRVLSHAELEHYCELVAALKLRTTNKNGRHLSTKRAIELLEGYGVETPNGMVQLPKGILTRTTVDRYLVRLKLNHSHITREPAAVRFQAEYSNDCWQFDISPSDLKYIDKPEWVDPAKGQPTLALFSVVDDRSGMAYVEYRCIYGEDAESALRFFFNAMAPKADMENPFQGRPKMIYLDNGPVAKSRVFQNVMQALDIAWQTHIPAGKDGRRTTARSKGKVERPFRTVKEAHETLYHFHKPETEKQANEWLSRWLVQYNGQRHRSELHSRLDDWLKNLPADGLREMCTWEQYCRFAREPERRKVGIDARISIEGTTYEVEPEMAGDEVVLQWGLFDDELYVEYDGERTGPYLPISGPIPLHRYRAFKRSKSDERADRIRKLADQLDLPISAVAGSDVRLSPPAAGVTTIPRQPFDAEVFEHRYPTMVAAKLAIANDLAMPLAKLSAEDRAFIDGVLAETLMCRVVLARVRAHFREKKGEKNAG